MTKSRDILDRPPETRFWARVDKCGPNGCWLWTGIKTDSYGRFCPVKHKTVPAHRFSYELAHGPIPKGLHLDHLCRNPSCVNPAHLEAVTPKENFLRGVGPTAVNAKKTHCKNGHLLAGDNLSPLKLKLGWRVCRACQAMHSTRCREKKLGVQS